MLGNVDGILAGDAAFVPGGISGDAVSMTTAGGGLVNMGDNFGFTSGDFSVVAWVLLEAGDQTSDYVIVGKHRATQVAGYILGANQNGGYGQTDKAWFYDSNGSPGDDPRSTTSINDGNWHQVVGVYHDGGAAEIYVDGAGVEDSKTADIINATSAPFVVGGLDFAGVPRSLINGSIDEVQLYDHALTDSQIQFLFENPGFVIPTPLPATTFTALRGIHIGGTVEDLSASDNVDVSVQRNPIQATGIVELEVTSISPVENPTFFDFTLEASAFFRSSLIQSIEFWDYDAGTWVEVDSRDASRFTDSVAVAVGTGDVSRFVEPGTGEVKTRIYLHVHCPSPGIQCGN